MTLRNRSINQYRRSLLLFLGGSKPDLFSFRRFTQTFEKAQMLVKAFYAVLCFFVFNNVVFQGLAWLKLTDLQPLWPLFWVKWIDITTALYMVISLVCLLTLLCLIYYENRWIRVGTFIGFLQFTALLNSFGKINHNFHVWLVISFIFIFLPHKKWHSSQHSVTFKQKYLLVFATAQIFFMTFYSMSGIWKIYAAIDQIQIGQTYHTFHPYAMAQQVSHRLLQTNSESILGPLVVNYPWLGTLPYLAAVYLETTAVIAVFRPSLHKFLGISFMVFHFSTWLTMSIFFNTNFILLALLFVFSPFAPPNVTLKSVMYNLPLLGEFLRFINKKRA
jgi:hypothetical protein